MEYDHTQGLKRVSYDQARNDKRALRGPKDAYERYLKPMSELDREELWVIPLDAAKIPLCETPIVVAQGDKSSVGAPITTLWRMIAEGHPHTAFVVMAHNHPMTANEPSEGDLEVTIRWMVGGEALGIEVLDHVIVSREGFESCKAVLAERQRLQDVRMARAMASRGEGKLTPEELAVHEAKKLVTMAALGRRGSDDAGDGESPIVFGGHADSLDEMMDMIRRSIERNIPGAVVGPMSLTPTKKPRRKSGGDETIH